MLPPHVTHLPRILHERPEPGRATQRSSSTPARRSERRIWRRLGTTRGAASTGSGR